MSIGRKCETSVADGGIQEDKERWCGDDAPEPDHNRVPALLRSDTRAARIPVVSDLQHHVRAVVFCTLPSGFALSLGLKTTGRLFPVHEQLVGQ